jgi:Pyridoxal-dependent decarboxylase conserved domain
VVMGASMQVIMNQWKRSQRYLMTMRQRQVEIFQFTWILPAAGFLHLSYTPVLVDQIGLCREIAGMLIDGLNVYRNFELPCVKSINTSGHKFGLVYTSVRWIIWQDESCMPKHLFLVLHYLRGTEESYALNFSRLGARSSHITGIWPILDPTDSEQSWRAVWKTQGS